MSFRPDSESYTAALEALRLKAWTPQQLSGLRAVLDQCEKSLGESDLRCRILDSSHCLTENAVEVFLGHTPDPEHTLALQDPLTGRLLYPSYQFWGPMVVPVISLLLNACGHQKYRLAAWLCGPHIDFHGKPPNLWLNADPERVLASFRASLEPQTHG